MYACVRSGSVLHPRVNGVSGKRGEGGFGSGELSAESWGVFKKNKRQKGITPYIIGGSRAFCCPLV